MVKKYGNDIYSDLTTKIDKRPMNSDSNRKQITKIVIHHNATTNLENAINTWLLGSTANTSAHYEITPTDIFGIVGENSVAYHAGNYEINQSSIGIEHLNSTGAPYWLIDENTYINSAKLIADLCKRYGLPVNSNTIVPHKSIVATACPGGIDMKKLISMAQKYAGESPTPPDNKTSAIQKFKNAQNQYVINSSIKVDEIKFHKGIWQFVNYELAGGRDFNWDLNGIPMEIVSRVDGGDNNNVGKGAMVKFDSPWNTGTIDSYDVPTNGVGIIFDKFGIVWFNADTLLKL